MTLQMIGSAIQPVTWSASTQPAGVNSYASSGSTSAGGGIGNIGGTPSLAAAMGNTPVNGGSGVSGAPNSAVPYIGDAIGAVGLANKLGAFGGTGSNSALSIQGGGSAVGVAGGLLSAYTGFEQGGALGDAKGAVGLATAATQAGLLGGTAGTLGSSLPYIGAAIDLANFGSNWKSGATGADALNGAETGAEIGAYFGGIGALFGGVIGGVVGAVSSVFGPGQTDPEQLTANNYFKQYASATPQQQQQMAASLTPALNFQTLAGVMDAKNDSAGHATPLQQIFGTNGEGKFVSQMTNQINSAISKGTIPKNATPQQIYQSVVTPWLSNMKGNFGGGNTNALPNSTWGDVNGTKMGDAVQSAITNLIGQWQSGALTGSTPVGIAGQTLGTQLPAYGS